MAYRLPTFNLSVNIWRGTAPPPGPPALTVSGSFTWYPRYPINGASGSTNPQFTAAILRVPSHVDIRDGFGGGTFDLVEVPAGTGRLYQVNFVEDLGKGFANEHRVAQVTKHVITGFSVWNTHPWP